MNAEDRVMLEFVMQDVRISQEQEKKELAKIRRTVFNILETGCHVLGKDITRFNFAYPLRESKVKAAERRCQEAFEGALLVLDAKLADKNWSDPEAVQELVQDVERGAERLQKDLSKFQSRMRDLLNNNQPDQIFDRMQYRIDRIDQEIESIKDRIYVSDEPLTNKQVEGLEAQIARLEKEKSFIFKQIDRISVTAKRMKINKERLPSAMELAFQNLK